MIVYLTQLIVLAEGNWPAGALDGMKKFKLKTKKKKHCYVCGDCANEKCARSAADGRRATCHGSPTPLGNASKTVSFGGPPVCQIAVAGAEGSAGPGDWRHLPNWLPAGRR